MIRKFKTWCENVTPNELLEDFIDTLFIFSLVLSVLFMHYKSGQCITTFINEKGSYEEQKYYLEYSKYQIKAYNIIWNIYINVLPEILILYASFWILFTRKYKTTPVKEQWETDTGTKPPQRKISEEI